MNYPKTNQLDVGNLKRKNGKNYQSPYQSLLSTKPLLVRRKKYKFGRPIWKTLSFALSGFVLVFTIQALVYLTAAKNATGEILGAATSAYGQLDSAGKNLTAQDFGKAQSLFQEASTNIAKAQNRLNDFKILTWVAPQANSAQHLLVGSGFLAEAGSKLADAINLFENFEITTTEEPKQDINLKISTNRKLLFDTRGLIIKSLDEFDEVKSIPTDYEGAFVKAVDQLNQLRKILDNVIEIQDLYLSLFSGEKTYLMVFQNYDEARATGGFLGTYGSLKTSNGSIRDLKIESIYNVDGQITTDIAAPGPFQPAIKKWGIRDANWFVDFRQSAEKLLFFYEKGKETAHGVLALTPKTYIELLYLTGPIEMPEYGVILTPDNFQDVVQYKTSVDYDRELNQPKKFLDDFAPILLDRLSKFSKEEWMQAVGIITSNLQSRHIMMYSTDPKAQQQIEELGFSGKILETEYDYLSINNSNLGGTKTDLEVKQRAVLESKILSDGSIMNTLQIIRNNNSNEINKNYLRILVPQESQLISAVGFNQYDYYKSEVPGMRTDPDLAIWDKGHVQSDVLIHQEGNKTEFSGWVITDALSQKIITITYILPFKLQLTALDGIQSYSLLLQKQSGSLPWEFQATINLGSMETRWSSQNVIKKGSLLYLNSNSIVDDFWAFVLQK